jgi:hypothetical protein
MLQPLSNVVLVDHGHDELVSKTVQLSTQAIQCRRVSLK